MRFSGTALPIPSIDAIAETSDEVDIRIEDRAALGQTLYVDVNGMTILRIGQLKQEVEITRPIPWSRMSIEPDNKSEG